MSWFLVAALGIMWVAFLVPTGRRGRRRETGVEEFERRMELLARAEARGTTGRWIFTPRKGMRFVGPAERQRARARERRRHVFSFLLEAITLTFLIGLVPPLRTVFWIATGGLVGLLFLYSWLLLSIKARTAGLPSLQDDSVRVRVDDVQQQQRERYVAEGAGNTHARPTHRGFGSVGEGDHVHVVVRPAGAVARA